MTIEEKFFKTFEIKPKYMYDVTDTFYTDNSHTYTVTKSTLIKRLYSSRYKVTLVHKSYPEITDRILLTLIEFLLKQQQEFYFDDEYLFSSKLIGTKRPTCNRCFDIKELVLRTIITMGQFKTLKDEIIQQVQQIFERIEE